MPVELREILRPSAGFLFILLISLCSDGYHQSDTSVFDRTQYNQALDAYMAAGGGRSSAIRYAGKRISRDGAPGHREAGITAVANGLRTVSMRFGDDGFGRMPLKKLAMREVRLTYRAFEGLGFPRSFAAAPEGRTVELPPLRASFAVGKVLIAGERSEQGLFELAGGTGTSEGRAARKNVGPPPRAGRCQDFAIYRFV